MLTVRGNEVVYEANGEIQWSLAADELKIVGEYTTSGGPMEDDWFFVFCDTPDGNRLWQATALAVDHKEFWQQLGQRLGCAIAPGLFASTNWASRVIYPPELEGHELFTTVKATSKLKGIWQRIFGSEKIRLTDEVKQFLVNSPDK